MENQKSLCKAFLLSFLLVFFSVSCSDNDYLDAIPANSNAVLSIDLNELGNHTKNGVPELINTLFGNINVDNAGISLTDKIYFFETTDGNLGCCLKVKDKGNLKEWLEKRKEEGKCSRITDRRNASFCMINNSWMVGFSSEAMLIMGPVLASQQAEMSRQISKYLNQNTGNSIRETPLFYKLDSLTSSIALVAQASALPDKLVFPFTLCMPPKADLSQIVIAATVKERVNGCITIGGETFSFNPQIDKQIKQNSNKLNVLKGKFNKYISEKTLCSLLLNADGNDFIEMLQNSDAMSILLAGTNTVIDADKILKSVNGDMAFCINGAAGNETNLTIYAQLKDKEFTKDVSYWKESCPSGCRIEQYGNNAFCLKNTDNHFYFGVTADNIFYGSSKVIGVNNILKNADYPLDKDVLKQIDGQRFCLILNIDSLLKENKEISFVSDLLKPVFGNIRNVIYTLK